MDDQRRARVDEILSWWTPHRAAGYKKDRFGRDMDGGYCMIDDFDGIKVAISAGICDDDSWERAIIDRGPRVIAFECSPHHVISDPKQLPYQMFITRMDGYVASGNSTLDLVLSGYGDNEAILKMDIEGGEWPVFENTSLETLRKIRQITCEFHFHFESDLKTLDERGYGVFKKLNEVFKIVHVHGNNSQQWWPWHRTAIPLVLEITFANHYYYDLTPSGEVFPSELDRPNAPMLPEIVLNKFIP